MKAENSKKYIPYLISLLMAVGVLVYILAASEDVAYSDYIRLVNEYFPDVTNFGKVLTPDVLVRTPITYLFRIINTGLFHYSVNFDRIVGLSCSFITSVILIRICQDNKIDNICLALMLLVHYSLAKREMLLNGTGYVHFMTYIPFYLHFYFIDRLYKGTSGKNTVLILSIITWLTVLLVSGPYCAVYCVTVAIIYCVLFFGTKTLKKNEWIILMINTVLPLILYLISNSFVNEYIPGAKDVSLITVLTQYFGYTVRFMLDGFASTVLGGDLLNKLTVYGHLSLGAAHVLGVVVILGYAGAFCVYFKAKIWERTLAPLCFMLMGIGNHFIVFLGRYFFLREQYAWSSRYFLQYQVGILGILMVFAIYLSERRQKNYRKQKNTFLYRHSRNILAAVAVLMVAGCIATDIFEISDIQNRHYMFKLMKAVELNFENEDDGTLDAMYEYKSGADDIRNAFSILKENGLNVFYKAD